MEALKSGLTYRLKQLQKHFLLVIILVVAVVLRFYRMTEIPYMHDELSALLRTEFSSFGELLDKGVKIDGHPALIQSFLYFWTKLVGTSEWIVKLPFLLMSVGSVYLGYCIGKRWFSLSAGLLVAAFLATTEYTIMYGQIIRPYGSGLFFTLLMALHWGEMVFYTSRRWKNRIWFVIAASLCAYNHHFSLLIAGLFGVFGLLLVARENRWFYLKVVIFVPILYLPHLSIFFYQLSVGGIEGWLGKPTPDFLWHYVQYLFHFSWIAALGFGLAVFVGWKFPKNWKNSKQQLFCVLLFSVNYAIGYYYSVYGTSVMQPSVLIFSMPFLILYITSFTGTNSRLKNTILVCCVLFGFGVTLIQERNYYEVFYVPTFKQLVLDANEANARYSKIPTLIFSDEPKTRFYEPKLQIHQHYRFITTPDFTLKQLSELLEIVSKKSEYFFLANTSSLPPQYNALIQHYFPIKVASHNYFSANTTLFKKGKTQDKPLVELKPNTSKNWTGIDSKNWKQAGFEFNDRSEWGPTFKQSLRSLIDSRNDYFDVVATVKSTIEPSNLLLVLNVIDKDSVIYYGTTSNKDFHWNPLDSTITLVQSLKLIDLPFDKFENPEINFYLWNQDKQPLLVKSFRLYRREGNALTYALFEPILKN